MSETDFEYNYAEKPYHWLYPAQVVLVSSVNKEGKANIITLAWAMPASFNPFMVAICVGNTRYSHKSISETREFVLGIPSENMVEEALFCGTTSGRDTDKFSKLTPMKADCVKPPLIKECMANMECKVVASIGTGDHTIFVGEVVKIHDSGRREKKLFDRGNRNFIGL
ncbi:MAG: flavin reductase family protein [Candidatus Micrarchaeia archaeon]